MGAHLAKPENPSDTKAKADADLAMDGMVKEVDAFFANIRLGEPTMNTLGYPLTDQRLIAQSYQLMVQTAENAAAADIDKAIDDIFSGDWKDLLKIAANKLASFLGGDVPKPENRALNESMGTSVLRFEDANVVQYSFLVKKSNSTSLGTLTQDSRATLMIAMCKGYVDYAEIDPQTVVGMIEQLELNEQQTTELMKRIEEELRIAAELSQVKRELKAGTKIPSENTINKV